MKRLLNRALIPVLFRCSEESLLQKKLRGAVWPIRSLDTQRTVSLPVAAAANAGMKPTTAYMRISASVVVAASRTPISVAAVVASSEKQ
jgi:hypothetical protein